MIVNIMHANRKNYYLIYARIAQESLLISSNFDVLTAVTYEGRASNFASPRLADEIALEVRLHQPSPKGIH